MRGAYYPKYHFEQVIQALVSCIESHGGQIIYNQKVTQFSLNKKNITAVTTVNMQEPTQLTEYTAKQVVCNFDPKQAAAMIGFQHFSSRLRQQLSYDYSCSNFVVYGAVKDIDLRDYGFGNWNIFHSEQININQVFDDMYYKSNYTKPSFAITTPSLVSDDPKGCPPGHQIFQLLTVANYNYFKDLKLRNQKDYLQQKKQIYNTMLDVIEKHYVPHFREHVCFKMLGSPTTNESFCFAPEGNSYGSNMTPQNTRLNRLGFKTSLNNFYFCNASSGYAGFTSSFANGARLYEYLTDDVVPNDI
jgi:phytoene dehydrogenase-like protein